MLQTKDGRQIHLHQTKTNQETNDSPHPLQVNLNFGIYALCTRNFQVHWHNYTRLLMFSRISPRSHSYMEQGRSIQLLYFLTLCAEDSTFLVRLLIPLGNGNWVHVSVVSSSVFFAGFCYLICPFRSNKVSYSYHSVSGREEGLCFFPNWALQREILHSIT